MVGPEENEMASEEVVGVTRKIAGALKEAFRRGVLVTTCMDEGLYSIGPIQD